MKNLTAYTGDAFEFFKEVKSKKQSQDLKNRLTELEANLEELFEQYDYHFRHNSLHLLEPFGYKDQAKDDLEELYSYRSATLVKLRTELTTTPTGRVVKCQNCTINNINTFDHLVPQGIYTEYNVHPKNLLCCCGDCNPRKGSNWRTAESRTTLNLYLDHLPVSQYLYVDVDILQGSVTTEFFLANPGDIEDTLFDILCSHYEKLNLFQRFSESADNVITSFLAIFLPSLNFLPLDQAILLSEEAFEEEKLAFGSNYWETILKTALVNHQNFNILL